ncbi:hypothetical protein H5410_011145 [Solanum commersonii]|uniref:Uncharacterized protein n=1 Tax=Solanum commersonii TaxID=4109 RepID=A0A9J6APC5_SOLCO|nr:hypothetical protein H5410_011145 [Solanum commersonii]
MVVADDRVCAEYIEPSKSSSNKRNGVGPDNPKGSKSSDMDQNQKDDPYSIAYCVVALNDMSGIDRRLTI